MPINFETIKGSLRKAIAKRKAGAPKVVVQRVAGPSSYPSGGFDVNVGELGEVIAGFVTAEKGYLAEIDWANSNKNTLKIKVYSGPNSEVSSGSDLSGVNFIIVAFGW